MRRNFSRQESRYFWESFLANVGGGIWVHIDKKENTEALRKECRASYDEFIQHCLVLPQSEARLFWIGLFLRDREKHRTAFIHPDEVA